jgi:protein SCO1/2
MRALARATARRFPPPTPQEDCIMHLKSSLLLTLAIFAVAGGGFAAFELAAPQTANSSKASIGGPFALTDQTGKPVTDQTYRGRVMVVLFGYTYCPDICPASLGNISDALHMLGREADKVAPIFITIDPARDTQKRLAAYMSAFDEHFVGLTGTPQQIERAAKAYRVYYAKHERKGSEGSNDYLMDHSAFIYVMDRRGNLVRYLRPTDTPRQIAAAIRAALAI